MDWNQSTMYEQRVRFILEVQQRTFSFAESCRRYGISRTAGYTWWNRFLAEGFEGLHDRSHRPHHCPHAVAEPIVEHVVDLRQRYGWGSRKIRKLTAVKFGSAPARRTIDRIFERHDLITKKRRRSGKPGHPGKPLTPMDEPNAVWTVDFKGQFKMRNGRYCYPLTITARPSLPSASLDSHGSAPGGSVSVSVLRPSSPESRSRTAATNACTELSSAKPLARPRPTSVPSSATSTTSATPSITSARTRLSTMRLPNQSTDRLLEFTPRPSLLSSTPNTSRSVKSLQMEASDGTRVGSTSARRWATSSSASNPSVPRCGKSTSDPPPSGGLTKNSSSFLTPTATREEIQSVNHQVAHLC